MLKYVGKYFVLCLKCLSRRFIIIIRICDKYYHFPLCTKCTSDHISEITNLGAVIYKLINVGMRKLGCYIRIITARKCNCTILLENYISIAFLRILLWMIKFLFFQSSNLNIIINFILVWSEAVLIAYPVHVNFKWFCNLQM